ncbi:MAG: transposase [Akkermansiaceae bacterium]|nr:transposase [Verrucomicrobiales bacterium]
MDLGACHALLGNNVCTLEMHSGIPLGKAKQRTGYPGDVSHEEWASCAPYPALMREDALQRKYPLRDLLNALRLLVRAGWPRRWLRERSFAWAARFRRLSRDYQRLATTMAGYHWLAFAILMLHSLFPKSARRALARVRPAGEPGGPKCEFQVRERTPCKI